MFVSPQKAIEEGWITFPANIKDTELYIQPNAIDFTLDKLFEMKNKSFFLHEQFKEHRGANPVEVQTITKHDIVDEYYKLEPNSVYDAVSNFYVKLPEGVAALLIIRSTLNRNGLFLTSGLYDSGYEGNIGFALHNRAKSPAYLAEGVRVGQIIFCPSDSVKLYAGQYNTEDGKYWAEKDTPTEK